MFWLLMLRYFVVFIVALFSIVECTTLRTDATSHSHTAANATHGTSQSKYSHPLAGAVPSLAPISYHNFFHNLDSFGHIVELRPLPASFSKYLDSFPGSSDEGRETGIFFASRFGGRDNGVVYFARPSYSSWQEAPFKVVSAEQCPGSMVTKGLIVSARLRTLLVPCIHAVLAVMLNDVGEPLPETLQPLQLNSFSSNDIVREITFDDATLTLVASINSSRELRAYRFADEKNGGITNMTAGSMISSPLFEMYDDLSISGGVILAACSQRSSDAKSLNVTHLVVWRPLQPELPPAFLECSRAKSSFNVDGQQAFALCYRKLAPHSGIEVMVLYSIEYFGESVQLKFLTETSVLVIGTCVEIDCINHLRVFSSPAPTDAAYVDMIASGNATLTFFVTSIVELFAVVMFSRQHGTWEYLHKLDMETVTDLKVAPNGMIYAAPTQGGIIVGSPIRPTAQPTTLRIPLQGSGEPVSLASIIGFGMLISSISLSLCVYFLYRWSLPQRYAVTRRPYSFASAVRCELCLSYWNFSHGVGFDFREEMQWLESELTSMQILWQGKQISDLDEENELQQFIKIIAPILWLYVKKKGFLLKLAIVMPVCLDNYMQLEEFRQQRQIVIREIQKTVDAQKHKQNQDSVVMSASPDSCSFAIGKQCGGGNELISFDDASHREEKDKETDEFHTAENSKQMLIEEQHTTNVESHACVSADCEDADEL